MQPVQLIWVKNIISRTVKGAFQELSFAVRALNIGYGKRVAVHWCGEDGIWRETPAVCCHDLPDGFEMWKADLVFPLARGAAIPGNIQLAVCLERDGEQYWDSRFGSNYRSEADSGVVVFGPENVRVVGHGPDLSDGLRSLPLEVAVRQEARPQEVLVHWSTDGWVTERCARAHFRPDHWARRRGSRAPNPNRQGWEMWAAQLPVGRAYRVEYAVECRLAGGPARDNLFGGNYRARRSTLKAMTLNLHTYQEEDQLKKFAQVARAIRELDLDIVCLQEVGENWNDGEGDWASNAANLINAQLPKPYHLHTDWSHRGFDRYREGVAILSRHPFTATDSGYVSDSRDCYDIHSRKVVMAQMRIPCMGLVNVFSVHLSWPSDGFYPQFERLQAWAEARQTPETAATLIGGDFNIAAGSEAFRHIVDTGAFEEQFMKITKPAVFQHVFRDRVGDPMQWLAEDGRIDFLWLNTGARLRAVAAGEIFTPGRYGRVSDHTGYWVEFELR